MTAPLLAYYGDDFTGSADVMEVLQWAGLRTVLFLQPPTPEQLGEFPGLRAFGVAGWSRSMSPAEMDRELQPVLQQLRSSGASIVHYKICSTFDSSPEIGSIGRVLEIGRDVFGEGLVPMLIGAPNLARYQVFGNLFARSGLDSEPFRLDRHPTMTRHPITPMLEADVRVHLARQTALKVELCDVLKLDAGFAAAESPAIEPSDAAALLFDVLTPEHLPRIGAVIQTLADRRGPTFVIGSSGVESALTTFWSRTGLYDTSHVADGDRPRFAATDQLLVITGTCSPVNDRQIAWAERNGFEVIPLDPARLVKPESQQDEIERAIQQALGPLRRGANVILHTSRGPHDPRIAETRTALQSLGLSELEIKLHSGRMLGPALGGILRDLLAAHPLRRVGIAGGDTSGSVARELGLVSLEAIAPVAPGSPLCRASAKNILNGLEIVFKGGQVGKDDVWTTMLRGTCVDRQNAATN